MRRIERLWLLNGRRVVALTADSATIATSNGGWLTYRRVLSGVGALGYLGELTVVTRKNAENTRGRPFEPGNPGRPSGSRNRASLILDKLGNEAASDILQAVIQQAKGGDVAAAKVILDRLWPPPRGRVLAFDLPAVAGLTDIKSAHIAILAAVGAVFAESAQGISPRAAHRSGREPLDSSGSCHRAKATAFR
jgi:hypothetical protein